MTSGLECKPHSLRLRPILEQPNSPLLCLPGELRNRIYGYTLEYELGYIVYQYNTGYSLVGLPAVRKSSFVGEFSGFYDDEDKEFNQLKYVCRQLHTETACLELKFNSIDFRGDLDAKKAFRRPAQLFTEFLKECAPTKASWLSRVELELGGPVITSFTRSAAPLESSVTLEIVADFCRMHPQCKVKYHIEAFIAEDDPVCFFTQGHFITRAVRHKKIQDLMDIDYLFDSEEADGWATPRCVKRLDVPNFRIFPSKDSYIYDDFLSGIGEPRGMTDAEMEVCLKLAKDWVNNGI